MNVSSLFDTLSTQFERLIMVFETWTTNYTCTAALMWKIILIFFDCTQTVIKAANVCLTCILAADCFFPPINCTLFRHQTTELLSQQLTLLQQRLFHRKRQGQQ